MQGYCTEGHSSVGMVMMGCQLDLILEVFSYLNYSVMILFPSAVVFFCVCVMNCCGLGMLFNGIAIKRIRSLVLKCKAPPFRIHVLWMKTHLHHDFYYLQ